MSAFFLLFQQVAQLSLQFSHLGVEVYLLVAVAELYVLAGDETVAFLFYFFAGGGVAVFRLVVVGLLVACTLPVVIGVGNLAYLLRRELDVFLLERLAFLPQVDEEHCSVSRA